ncbi:hypothetical protein DSL72_007652 [Monilinia vaccinii-corymbosi]|uniref:F-box domain-containing protein n=1 Tax=Monilinia vaccinii-corymbosi TaxID=61207 RepID=A0A8A3PIF3_9HELO|nr:hypothetical protein DSL72_007652 [Monilinia vaccinii-corymbosi]
MDIDALKRSKLKRTYSIMETAMSKGKGKQVMARLEQNAWKPNKIPVEIFNLIIKHLPRSTIQAMRLVNREFEANVSEHLFKYVVVPFRPEIYGILSEPSTFQSSIMLQDKGMRIFQGFGRHIRHFAMSFEVDVAKLTNPPIKHDHDTIVTFWGSYKWPFQSYNRYAQLEGLEQRADETHTMTKALQFVENAEELGLSIDGGLGWLAGPDVNQMVVDRGEKPEVFGSSRFVRESSQSTSLQRRNNRPSRSELSTKQRSMLQQMLVEAGYRNEVLGESLNDTHSDAGQASTANAASTQGPDGRRRRMIPYAQFEEGLARIIVGESRNDSSAATTEEDRDFFDGDIVSSEGEAEGNSQGEGSGVTVPSLSAADDLVSSVYNGFDRTVEENEDRASTGWKKPNPYPLKPNDLTGAQKEMLLELEWAQRAFMQTFTISVIDSPVTFVGVKKLTIARLPNTHLPILVRDDFWDSLPNLNLLSLGIIPDWRELAKLPTGWVQDNRLLPSKAVTGVFQLLFKQISQRQNIQSLHFEWICGGEYAPGLFCRNQHVLAAPVVSHSIEMINRVEEKEVLSLPYIQNLSLKNCWFSPHIFTRFVKDLKRCNLQHLTLDSVSLTAFIRPGAHPTPLISHALNHQHIWAQAMAANVGVGHQFVPLPVLNQPGVPGIAGPPAPLPVVAHNPNVQPGWLNQPRYGSWAQVIDTLTPGSRLADFRYDRGFDEEPEPKEQSGFKKLVFKSCGYVRIPFDFDQSSLPHHSLNSRSSAPFSVTRRINDYESMMMKSGDNLLGSVTNTMIDHEVKTLEEAWNMNFGWGSPTSRQVIEAKQDGIMHAGVARFSGSIEAPAPDAEMTDL